MSGPLVRASLDGRKTQTRRVVKPGRDQPWGPDFFICPRAEWKCGGAQFEHPGGGPYTWTRCPYGQPGDLLWVRETHWRLGRWVADGFTKTGRQRWRFASDGQNVMFEAPASAFQGKRRGADQPSQWWRRPGIHMPRWASRLTLTITHIRVQRVQDISRRDAISEGIQRDSSAFMQGGWWDYGGPKLPNGDPANITTNPVRSFEGLWDEINGKQRKGKPDLSWQANPWVWAITYRPIAQNVDGVLRGQLDGRTHDGVPGAG